MELAWDAPEGCPKRDYVRGRIRELLGAAADRTTRLHAEGKIVRINSRYRLTLTVREAGVDNDRIIESDSCLDLAGAAAVALGLLIRVELQAQEGTNTTSSPTSEPNSTGTPPTESPTTPRSNEGSTPDDSRRALEPRPEIVPNPVPPRSDTGGSAAPSATQDSGGVHLLIQAPVFGVDVGPLPTPRPNVGGGIGMQISRWRLTLGARVGRGETVWSSSAPAYGAELTRLSGELRSCYAFGGPPWSLSPCVLLTLDRVTASGVGREVASRTAHTLLFGAGVGALGRWQFAQSVGLVLSIGAQIETSRPEIAIDGLGEVLQLAPGAFMANTGVEWIL